MLKHQIAEIYRDHTTKVIAVYSVNVDVFQLVSAAGCYASIEPGYEHASPTHTLEAALSACPRSTSISLRQQLFYFFK